MFSGGEKLKAELAQVTLCDGRTLAGKILIAETSNLTRVLNSEASFLEFETHDGARSKIAASAIVEVAQTDLPNVRRLNVDDTVNPYKVLGLEKGANAKEVKAAYISMTKLYHPDRFSSMDLPKEMSNYVDEMSRRINSAYSLLNAIFDE